MSNPSISNAPSKSKDNNDETTVIVEKREKLQFPLEVKREVRIRRKRKMAILPGYNVDDERPKIGSSFKGSATLTGLTKEEEKRFISRIINADATTVGWNEAIRKYYAEMSVEIPPDNRDGSPGGLKLEVGLRYEKKEDYEKDQNAPRNEWGVIINPAGEPINIADYILYRYCLEYSEVANKEELVNASPRIRFFLYTKEIEVQTKKLALAKKREANRLVSQNVSDRKWVDFMLRNLIAEDKDAKILLKDLHTLEEDERDIMLDSYLEKNPARFLELGTDKHLETKAFIEQCIASGLLSRIPNTHTVLYEGVAIGNTVEETVAFLNNPKNSGTLSTLKAQSNVIP